MTSTVKHLLGISSVLVLAGAMVACDDGSTGGDMTGSGGSLPGAGGGVAAGGTPGAGGGAATGGATGGVDVPSTFATDGYGINDPWQGYLFTVVDEVGGSIEPKCDDAGTEVCFTASGANLCVSGSLAGSYESFALVGWNVNQPAPEPPATEAPAPALWTTTGTGVTVAFTNNGGPAAKFRIQLQGLTKAEQWCAAVPTGGGTVPWTDFKTNCWEGGTPQTPFTVGTGIAQVQVQQYSTSEAAPAVYDFCVTNIALAP